MLSGVMAAGTQVRCDKVSAGPCQEASGVPALPTRLSSCTAATHLFLRHVRLERRVPDGLGLAVASAIPDVAPVVASCRGSVLHAHHNGIRVDVAGTAEASEVVAGCCLYWQVNSCNGEVGRRNAVCRLLAGGACVLTRRNMQDYNRIGMHSMLPCAASSRHQARFR